MRTSYMTLELTRDGEHLPFSHARIGCIEVICGSMFSGKTEELLRRIKRAKLARQRVVLFKPKVDNRYDEVKVVTHEGVNADAVAVADASELMTLVQREDEDEPRVSVVGIDEVQFFGDDVVACAESLANRGDRKSVV